MKNLIYKIVKGAAVICTVCIKTDSSQSDLQNKHILIEAIDILQQMSDDCHQLT